jgi:hypothetical protein
MPDELEHVIKHCFHLVSLPHPQEFSEPAVLLLHQHLPYFAKKQFSLTYSQLENSTRVRIHWRCVNQQMSLQHPFYMSYSFRVSMIIVSNHDIDFIPIPRDRCSCSILVVILRSADS